MKFIYYVNFVAGLIGSVVDLFPQASDIVYAGITGGIDFDDVHRPAFGDGFAHLAGIAGLTLTAGGQAIHRFGQDAAGTGFTGAARPAKKIGMRNPAAIQGIKQSLGYRFLPDDISECLGTPFTIKYLRHFTMVYYTLSRKVSQKNILAAATFYSGYFLFAEEHEPDSRQLACFEPGRC